LLLVARQQLPISLMNVAEVVVATLIALRVQ